MQIAYAKQQAAVKKEQEQRDRERKEAAEKRRSTIIGKYGETIGNYILSGKVVVGMTREQCRESWGSPNRVNKTTTAYTLREQWVYSSSRYLYFENGVLTTIQN